MATNSKLVDLPVEILDTIVRHLSLEDTRSLRLTSILLAAKIANTCYRQYFQTKTIVFTPLQLTAFSVLTKQAWISSALRNLKIIGLASQIELPSNAASEESLPALIEALSNVHQRSAHNQRHLQSLTLDIVNDGESYGPSKSPRRSPPPPWQSIWELAANIALLVGQAVKSSRLQVERLNIFADSERCALGAEYLRQVMDNFDASSLRALSIAVSADSHHCEEETEYEARLPQDMVDVLASTPHLERLDIRYFSLNTYEVSDEECKDRDLLASLAKRPLPLPQLTELSLRGVWSPQDSFLTLITAYPGISTLVLEKCRLTDGRWVSIFAYLDGQDHLHSLYLNDLHENRLIQFIGASGDSHFPHPGGPTWLRRTPEKRRHAIRYQQMRGRASDSVPFMNWWRRSIVLYGPVDNHQ